MKLAIKQMESLEYRKTRLLKKIEALNRLLSGQDVSLLPLVCTQETASPLEMLDAYCRENRLLLQGKAFAGQGAYGAEGLSEEQERRIETFYKFLKNSPRGNEILIPIRIDPCSGAGLYITGKEHYQSIPLLSNKIEGNCRYAFFWPDEIPQRDSWIFLLHTTDEESYNFPNLDEALSWYAAKCRGTSISQFRDVNGPVPANCPEEFRLYFQNNHAQDVWAAGELSVSKEDLEAAAAEVGEPPERRNHNG